ncbi:MAG: bifunctional UDP-N-acetylglucosamine diphosphorylase/glucosamine-1-phosphate N-acetyltransferase GlmU [Myxococcota bacterium]
MTTSCELALLLLAAGKGTRMRSSLPKLLHPLCGRTILEHQLALCRALGASRVVVVVACEADRVRERLAGTGVETCVQEHPRGTGDAVLQARTLLEGHPGPVVTLYGDHPLYRPETIRSLVETHTESGADLTLLTGEFPETPAFGRIVRGRDGRIVRIVEAADASAEDLALREVNLGVYVASPAVLFEAVAGLSDRNEQGEYYLTDIVASVLGRGLRVETARAADWSEALGVNDRVDLAAAESQLRRRINQGWQRAGVTMVDPEHTYVDVDVEIGADSMIEPGATLRQGTRIGERCHIATGSVLDASELGRAVVVRPHCWLESARVGDGCVIGPSAHLRPHSVLEREVRIGNFVEVKNSHLGAGTKADHLSYVGDADVGAGVTIGCGAITVNYDGRAKHRTRIGDGAFVGCNSNLIAPVEVAERAYVAAGSTITDRVPGGALGVARARQRVIEGWRARRFESEPDE